MTRALSTRSIFTDLGAVLTDFLAWILQYFGWYSVTSFGADPTGAADSTAAFQAALDIAGPHKVFVPFGTFSVGQLLIDQSYTTLVGMGFGTKLKFVPTANNQICIHVKLRTFATVISSVWIEGLRIYSTDTTYRKVGIQITDGSQTIVRRVKVGPGGSWTGGASIAPFTGGGSVGMKIRGREFGTFTSIMLCADFPLWIGTNPNAPTISIDHHVFNGEFYFIVEGADGPSVYIETGVVATNTAFRDGAWVGGNYGLFWPDTTSVSTSSMLTIQNVRPEQLNGTAGWNVYITKLSQLAGLTIDSMIAGSGNGVYLRGCGSVTFNQYRYNATNVALNIDATGGPFEWRNSFCQTGSTVSLGTLVRVTQQGFLGAGYPMAFNEWLYPPSATFTSGEAYAFMGVYQYAQTGTLTSGATVDLPTFGGSIKQGRIAVTFHGATKDGSMSVAITATNAFLEATSDATIMAAPANTASKFCVHYASASSCVLRNNLAESVTYSYFMFMSK